MLDVGGKVIADAEPDETDLDDLARAAVDVLQKYVAARHPESPGGVRIVHSETDDIKMRSEEHTSELQSLMRISYAVFCLKKKIHRQSHRSRIQMTTNQTINMVIDKRQA